MQRTNDEVQPNFNNSAIHAVY